MAALELLLDLGEEAGVGPALGELVLACQEHEDRVHDAMRRMLASG